jgi:hypothetical protein
LKWLPFWRFAGVTVSLLIFYFSICPEKVKRPSNFVDFYSYAFRYCLTGIMILWGTKFNLETWFLFFPYIFLHFEPSVFILSEEKQKSIDIESICELLDLVLGSQFRVQVDLFVEYLKVSGCLYGFLLSCFCLFVFLWLELF